MNAMCRFTVLALMIVGVVACTHMDERSGRAPRPAQDEAVDKDALYMARVEAIARQRGIGVVWINPPSGSSKPR